MAAAANITVSGSVTGTPAGNLVIAPAAFTSATAVGQTQQITLATNTAVALTVPATPNAPTGVLIQVVSWASTVGIIYVGGNGATTSAATGYNMGGAVGSQFFATMGSGATPGLFNSSGSSTVTLQLTWF